jgi:hypothetical protein
VIHQEIKSLLLALNIFSLSFALSLDVIAQQPAKTTRARTQTATTKPAAALATTFGKLVRVERRNKTVVRMVRPRGARNEVRRAETGKVFVILHFVGKASVELGAGSERSMSGFMASLGATFVRTTDQSWLTDGNGNKYESGLIVTSPTNRQLAFEIPAEATDLHWHDGKQSFRLEPVPQAVAK